MGKIIFSCKEFFCVCNLTQGIFKLVQNRKINATFFAITFSFTLKKKKNRDSNCELVDCYMSIAYI